MTIPHHPPRLGRRLVTAAALIAPLAARAAPSAVVSVGPGLGEVIGADTLPVPVYTEGLWCEGPVWAPGLGGLVFSDTKRNRISCLPEGGRAASLFDPSNNANGNGVDAAGRLLTCEHRGRRVVRRETNGALTVLADRYDGRSLNAPNDIAVARDGAVWFTDPTFGIVEPDEGRQATPEQKGRFVFRLDPSGRLDVADDGFEQPNGIVFSPDERLLYVSETSAALNPEGGREIRVFPVRAGGRLGEGRVFARVSEGVPDGLDVDAVGRVYAATAAGVQVWAPDGTALGRIAVPGTAGSLAFGGAAGRTLFICNGTDIHAVETRVRGAHV